MTQADDVSASRWHIAAAIAAWLLPGLGHYLLGHRARGAILALTIGLLWLGGLFIGGVSVFDTSTMRQNVVQVGQVFLAPSLVVQRYHGRLSQPGLRQAGPEDDPPFEPSFARTNEQGVLYTALAGLLNLLAVIDVLYRDPADARLKTGSGKEEG